MQIFSRTSPQSRLFRFQKLFGSDLPKLPEPYGQMTARIRGVYDIEMIHSLAMVCMKHHASDYTFRLDSARIRLEVVRLMQKFYGSILNFVKSHPRFFKLSLNQQKVRLRITKGGPVTAELLMDIMDTAIVKKGAMKLDTLAVLANDAYTNVAWDVWISSDEISEKYVAVTNKDKIKFLYRKEDEYIPQKGFTIGDNTATALVLEGAAQFLPFVPTYWVPYYDVCQYLEGDAYRTVRNRGIARMANLLPEYLLHGRFKDTEDDFCRRVSDSDLPACTVEYDGYLLGPARILKLAFSIPTELTHITTVYGKLFPSIARWGQESCQYSFADVLRMFPHVFELRKDGNVRSLLRGEHPALVPEDGDPAKLEEQFDAALAPDLTETLYGKIGSPNEAMFHRIQPPVSLGKEGYKLINWKGERFYIKRDAPAWTDKELLDYMLARLPEDDSTSTIAQLMDDLGQLPKNEFQKFRNALHLRHDSSMLKFMKRSAHTLEYEEVFQGANLVDHTFFRTKKERVINADANYNQYQQNINVAQVNEFLDPTRLLERFKEIYRLSGRRRKYIMTISSQLGERARTAAKQQGGVRTVVKAHPEIFTYYADDDSAEILDEHFRAGR